MSKRTVEIDDDLDERVQNAKDETKSDILELAAENPDHDFDQLTEDLRYNGRDHEIVDGCVPIYTSDIDGLYYLYGDEFEEAYQNAGIGNGDEENHKQCAIYCYIEEQVNEYVQSELKDEIEDELKKIQRKAKRAKKVA